MCNSSVSKTGLTMVAGALILTGATVALAQEPAPPRTIQEPAAPRTVDANRKRQIVIMERVLAQSVKSGGERLATLFRGTSQPGQTASFLFASEPEALGFPMPNGLFFYVRVPGMKSTVVWALQVLASQGRYTNVAAGQPATAPPVAPVDPAPLRDLDGEYTRQVKEEIVTAMIENSHALRLGPDEFLTVAARDDTPIDPLAAGDRSDVHAVTFTIRGSDLTAYHEGRITADEVRKRIVITDN